MRLNDFQQYVEEFSKEKGFNKISLDRRFMYLMTEIGEATKDAIKASDPTSTSEQVAEHKYKLGLELFDILWNLTDVANRLGIDLEVAFQEKMAINKERIWE